MGACRRWCTRTEPAGCIINGLRESVIQGDKAAIDTTEGWLQVQTRLLDLNFARLEQQNAALSRQVAINVTVLSVEPIYQCLMKNGMLPAAQNVADDSEV